MSFTPPPPPRFKIEMGHDVFDNERSWHELQQWKAQQEAMRWLMFGIPALSALIGLAACVVFAFIKMAAK